MVSIVFSLGKCKSMSLRCPNKTVYPTLGGTARLNNFVTVKYQMLDMFAVSDLSCNSGLYLPLDTLND